MSRAEQEPIPSAAHLAPPCDHTDCDGYRAWDLPNGKTFEGHCGCPKGRRLAELDYAHDHRSPEPYIVLAAAS